MPSVASADFTGPSIGVTSDPAYNTETTASAARLLPGTSDMTVTAATTAATIQRFTDGNPSLLKDFVDEAPTPVLAGLKRLNDRMLRLVIVFGGMTIRRRIAAADVTALQTQTQMHPLAAGLQTLFATVRRVRLGMTGVL
jgi:hypothetical protein